MTKKLFISNVVKVVHDCFEENLSKYNKKKGGSFPTKTYAMSCLAIFYFKWPSLLFYETNKRIKSIRENISSLFKLKDFPSDTQMRERLDEVAPLEFRRVFKKIFAMLQRDKRLEKYAYLNDCYLVSIDGTGYFSSHRVHCDNCCVKNHRNGTKTYHHQMLGASIVHPDHKEVIPFAPEPILKQDGDTKNDCERSASKRFLKDLRREHPYLKIIITEDALAANGPHLKLLKELNMHYIIGVKPADHKFLFDWVAASDKQHVEYTDDADTTHKFSFVNDVPLNDEHFEFKVNFLEYWETKKNGKKQHFTWVTDITITKKNVFKIMKGGRARWKIENETFNTLKNQGYNFEHNYGHGKNHLSTNMAMIMFLAFLIDQIQQLCCKLFQTMRKCLRTYYALWETLRSAVRLITFDGFEDMYNTIISSSQPP